MGEGTLDDGPGHDATLRRMLDINTFGRPSSRVPVDDISDVVGPGNPLPVLE